jgi:hypothetical protein
MFEINWSNYWRRHFLVDKIVFSPFVVDYMNNKQAKICLRSNRLRVLLQTNNIVASPSFKMCVNQFSVSVLKIHQKI